MKLGVRTKPQKKLKPKLYEKELTTTIGTDVSPGNLKGDWHSTDVQGVLLEFPKCRGFFRTVSSETVISYRKRKHHHHHPSNETKI